MKILSLVETFDEKRGHSIKHPPARLAPGCRPRPDEKCSWYMIPFLKLWCFLPKSIYASSGCLRLLPAQVRSLKVLVLAKTFVQNRGSKAKMLILAKTFHRNRGAKAENVDFS